MAAAAKRFSDPAWYENPLLHKLMQGYAAPGFAALAITTKDPSTPAG